VSNIQTTYVNLYFCKTVYKQIKNYHLEAYCSKNILQIYFYISVDVSLELVRAVFWLHNIGDLNQLQVQADLLLFLCDEGNYVKLFQPR
jgi:hypothetical protein